MGGLSGSQVLIDNCDVRLIPHFIPLVDLGGVVYPVRLLLDLSESPQHVDTSNEVIRSTSMESSSRVHSFTEVVAGKGVDQSQLALGF